MHNVARLFANPDHTTAEFAVMVRSDLSQRGLGFRLMTDLVEYARNRGLSALFGDEHVQNRRMLQLA
jgi:acetyltransferase